jgi:hypothetical protein
MMDQNKPARFLDTAYNALKANPGATNQILQAAAQGQPVGLRGLAAAAAQQSQQEAQKAMTALQQQGPQPNIIQKMATQGIMSQMDTGLPMAPQMSAPEEMPQQMAGGGLVSFADGGNVLPPDVIEAIQSHFAEGGEVRGFAGGEEIMALLRGAAEDLPYGEMGSFIEGPGATPRAMPTDYGPMGSFIEGAPREAPSRMDLLKKFLGKEISPAEIEAGIAAKAKGVSGKGLEAVSKFGKAAGVLGKVAGPLGYASSLYEVGNIIADPKNQAAFSEDWQREMPTWLGGSGEQAGETTGALDYDLSKVAPPKESGIEKAVRTSFENPEKSTWVPEPHDGHEVVPRQRVPVEGQKVSQEFKEAKKDVPSAAATPDSEVQGLGGLDQGKEMVDYIKSLYGEKKMDPEIAKKLADLESNARTSTILQSVLGGLAGGLSNPYGGRFALGSAALQALGGYQKGIGSEEDIQRKALDIERAYADQPADLQRAAAKEYFDLAKEKAKMLSAERVAGERSESALDRLLRSEEGKLLRSQIMSGQKGDVTEGQKLTAWNQAREQAAKEIKDEYIGATPPEGELERRTQKHYLAALNSIITATGGGLGAGQAQQQQSGLGAGAIPTGRSIIGGKLTGSSPQ